jgi:putative ABC transport system permease protein
MHLSPAAIESAIACWSRRVFVSTRVGIFRRAVIVVPRVGSPNGLIPTIRTSLKEFDPQMAVDFTTASDVVAGTLSRQELGMTLLLIFGATALVLAAIGIYGVIAYASAQREGEIATRIALGATSGAVFRLMLFEGQRMGVLGVILGVFVAYAGGRAASASVFAMRASDPLVLVSSTAIVALIALAATAVPAIRASRTDPIRALRSE